MPRSRRFAPAPHTSFLGLYFLALPAYTLLRVYEQAEWLRVMTFAVPSLLALFAATHMLDTRGARRACAMLVGAIGISFAAEAIGASTGLPFGLYHYTDTLGPKLFGLVPWLIPIAWLAMLYPAWEVIGFLLPGQRVARVLLSAAAFTAWDLSLDPRMVADGHWVWQNGGEYFGVPISNFIGWFATACVIFLVWMALDHPLISFTPFTPSPSSSPSSRSSPSSSHPLASQHLPVWSYIVIWLGESVANILFWSGPVVGGVVFVAMGLFGAPALVQFLFQVRLCGRWLSVAGRR